MRIVPSGVGSWREDDDILISFVQRSHPLVLWRPRGRRVVGRRLILPLRFGARSRGHPLASRQDIVSASRAPLSFRLVACHQSLPESNIGTSPAR